MASCPKRKKAQVQDILLYVEGQDPYLPNGQRQMKLLYLNKTVFSTAANKYRQIKINFAECAGWDAINERLASRDCLTVIGFKDTVKFPVIHDIVVEHRMMNMTFHFNAGAAGINSLAGNKIACFFTEKATLKEQCDKMATTDGAKGHVPDTNPEMLAMISDAIMFHQQGCGFVTGCPTNITQDEWDGVGGKKTELQYVPGNPAEHTYVDYNFIPKNGCSISVYLNLMINAKGTINLDFCIIHKNNVMSLQLTVCCGRRVCQ